MNIKFAHRMKDYEAGIFQVLNEKKDEAERQGRTIYNLSVGTPDFPPAAHVVEAVVKASAKPENYKYALIDIPELIEAVQTRYKKRYGVTLQKDEIMSVYGSQEGIAHICLSLCDPGDVVLVPNPGYPIFGIGPSLAGAEVVTYDLKEEDHYLPDLEAISQEDRQKAKLILVSYPNNPTGAIAPDSFYEELIRFAKENDILIIHDNAYSELVYDGQPGKSFLSFPGALETGVELNSFSKTYGMAGARLGVLAGNREAVSAYRELKRSLDYGIFLPVQYGGIEALEHGGGSIPETRQEYEQRRNLMVAEFGKAGWHIPPCEATMFLWAPIPAGMTSEAFALRLAETAGVLVTPGSRFGPEGEGFVRIAMVQDAEKIREAARRIADSGLFDSRS